MYVSEGVSGCLSLNSPVGKDLKNHVKRLIGPGYRTTSVLDQIFQTEVGQILDNQKNFPLLILGVTDYLLTIYGRLPDSPTCLHGGHPLSSESTQIIVGKFTLGRKISRSTVIPCFRFFLLA